MTELTATTTPGPFSEERYTQGFGVIAQVYEPDIVETLRVLVTDPQPLFRVLARYPRTLVHGDFKVTNLAWRVSSQLPIVALDWQLAAIGIPTMEVGWYAVFPNSPPAPPALCIDLYHQYLAQRLGSRWNESRWQALLELGLLTYVVRTCSNWAYRIICDNDQALRDNLLKYVPMCSDWVRTGVKWL